MNQQKLVYSIPEKNRYLGNSSYNKMELHDLKNRQNNCQIDEIIYAGNAVIFSPDIAFTAYILGYDNCHWCLGNSKR